MHQGLNMNSRRGVIFVVFDLPVKTADERKQYTRFRKGLKHSGYSFFQKSVYIKLLRNTSSASNEIKKVDAIAPIAGEVQVLSLNMKSFRSLFAVRGSGFNITEFSDDVIFLGNESNMEMDDEEMIRRFRGKER